MLSFLPYHQACAIDFSDLRLRLIQLKKSGRRVAVHCYNEVVVPYGYIVSGEIKEKSEVAKLISRLISKPIGGKILSPYIVASLPERRTYFKVFDIPLLPEQEVPGAVRWGIEQNIPVSLNDIAYDWHIVSKNTTAQQMLVAVVAIPKDISQSYSSILRDVHLTPVVLETESAAIFRALKAGFPETSDGILVVDLGASRTSLFLLTDGVITYSSTLELSGHEMTNAIARTVQLTQEQAEKAKIICGLDPKRGKGVIRKALIPLFEQLRVKATQVGQYYQNFLQKKAPLRVVLSGGVSQMIGLKEYVSEILNAEVSTGNPISSFGTVSQKQLLLPKSKLLSFTTAIGLGLRTIQATHRILP